MSGKVGRNAATIKNRLAQQQQRRLALLQKQQQQQTAGAAQKAAGSAYNYNVDYNDYDNFMYENLDDESSNPFTALTGDPSASIRRRQLLLAARKRQLLLQQQQQQRQMLMQSRLGGNLGSDEFLERSGYGHTGPVYVQTYSEPECATGLTPFLVLATLAGTAIAAYFIFIRITTGGKKRSLSQAFFGGDPDWETVLQRVIFGNSVLFVCLFAFFERDSLYV